MVGCQRHHGAGRNRPTLQQYGRLTGPTYIPLWIIAAHADEPSPLGVPAHATSNQLDRVARMLDAGGSYADARDLRLLAWVSCGAGV